MNKPFIMTPKFTLFSILIFFLFYPFQKNIFAQCNTILTCEGTELPRGVSPTVIATSIFNSEYCSFDFNSKYIIKVGNSGKVTLNLNSSYPEDIVFDLLGPYPELSLTKNTCLLPVEVLSLRDEEGVLEITDYNYESDKLYFNGIANNYYILLICNEGVRNLTVSFDVDNINTDTDLDGTPDCQDDCPNDPNKIEPGTCGCDIPETDVNSNGTPDCKECIFSDSEQKLAYAALRKLYEQNPQSRGVFGPKWKDLAEENLCEICELEEVDCDFNLIAINLTGKNIKCFSKELLSLKSKSDDIILVYLDNPIYQLKDHINLILNQPFAIKDICTCDNENEITISNGIQSSNNPSLVLPLAIHFQGVPNTANRKDLINLAVNQIKSLNQDFKGGNRAEEKWKKDKKYFPKINLGKSIIEFVIANKNHPSKVEQENLAITFNIDSQTIEKWNNYINILVKAKIPFNPFSDTPKGLSIIGGAGTGKLNHIFVNNKSFPDLIQIRNQVFGLAKAGHIQQTNENNLGGVLTHEMGHYLNLEHPWGNTNNCDGDNLTDTPFSSGLNIGMPSIPICSCGNPDLYMNFMDNTDDGARYMFTKGQVDRMEQYVKNKLTNVTTNLKNVYETEGNICSQIQIISQGNNITWSNMLKNAKVSVKKKITGIPEATEVLCNGNCSSTQSFPGVPSGEYIFTVDNVCPEKKSFAITIAGTSAPTNISESIILDDYIVKCSELKFSTENDKILIDGLDVDARVEMLGKNTNWQTIEVCNRNCSNSQVISNLSSGEYTIKVNREGANGSHCFKNEVINVRNDELAENDDRIANCQAVNVTEDRGLLTISGLQASYNKVSFSGKNTNWQEKVLCDGNCSAVMTKVLPIGEYEIKIQQFGSAGNYCFINPKVTTTESPNENDANCEEINFVAGNNSITLSNLNATKIEMIGEKTNWQVLSICEGDCSATEIIPNLEAGQYTVKVNQQSLNGQQHCYLEKTINVSSNNSSQGRANLNLATYQKQQQVHLQWASNETATTNYFLIERSTDGNNFQPLGMVSAKDKTGALNWVDKAPESGINYYRVRQALYNQQFRYSSIQSEQFFLDQNSLTVFPNPANESITLGLGHLKGKTGSIQLYNVYGVLVKELPKGKFETAFVTINTKDIENGIYLVTVKADHAPLKTKRFVVEHWR